VLANYHNDTVQHLFTIRHVGYDYDLRLASSLNDIVNRAAYLTETCVPVCRLNCNCTWFIQCTQTLLICKTGQSNSESALKHECIETEKQRNR